MATIVCFRTVANAYTPILTITFAEKLFFCWIIALKKVIRELKIKPGDSNYSHSPLLGGVVLLVSAQFVRQFPDQVMLLVIGVPVTLSALLQLSGYRFNLARQSLRVEATVGAIAGLMGGLSGIWGPPTVAYLTALDTPKQDQMRVQGVIYGLGSVALVGAHVASGVLRGDTWGFSAAMVPAAVLGMWLGTRVLDRIDQQLFRRATLCVLLLAGANLMRRGFFG